MKKLEGKIAVVTASTKGIGLASAKILAKNGAKVYIAARNESLGGTVVRDIVQNDGRAAYVYFDAEKPDTYRSIIDEPIRHDSRIDILVNNYGSANPKLDLTVTQGDTDVFFHTVTGNLKSVYLPCKYAIAHMAENGGGSIVNISSIGGAVPDFSRTGYAVSKAAINYLTQLIAVQYARSSIRCNAILPGLTATKAALDNMPQEFIESFLRHVPLGRVGTPEDIANAVLFLASDDSSYLTGELIHAAGGFALPTPQFSDYMS